MNNQFCSFKWGKKYTNPTEDINSRPLYPPDSEEFASMKEFLFSELTENTTIYYCVKDHSSETRTTKKHHQGSDCRLKTRMELLRNSQIML